ncbi:uncharacterized protein LOC120541466 isoform X2 [Polypterus senegalus]|uniref:uncharacterized protein LOC120541466 isoform X2 n=1 Tax=Polypterus senegalus TaxID=55291 RepID=UPI0019645D72|nr:uncharacterized protein LOC120541466 isoform X2 [Polypterus senegalus]
MLTANATLFLTIVTGNSSVTLITPKSPVIGFVGGKVTLNVSFNPPSVAEGGTWAVNSKVLLLWKGPNITFYQAGYTGRVVLDTNTGSLLLHSLTVDDSGEYNVTISVNTKTLSGVVQLNVTKPPPTQPSNNAGRVAGIMIGSFLGGMLGSVGIYFIIKLISWDPLNFKRYLPSSSSVNNHVSPEPPAGTRAPRVYENMASERQQENKALENDPNLDSIYTDLQLDEDSDYSTLQR